jgi:hypothetical protein
MTVRELAAVFGVSPSTIRRAAKRVLSRDPENGVEIRYTKEECMRIGEAVRKKRICSSFSQGGRVRTRLKEYRLYREWFSRDCLPFLHLALKDLQVLPDF